MIVPAGKRRHQVNQGGTKHESIVNSDLFEKIALGDLPGQMPGMPGQGKPDTGEIGDVLSQGGLDPSRHDRLDPKLNDHEGLGLAGENASSIAPSGHQPIKAQPTGVMPEEDIDVSQQPTFWSQLAQAISPFMKERFLQLLGSPKLTDNKNGVYELLMGPKNDPRTGQPMQLPDADSGQLYADAEQIAKAARGRIYGIPFIDSNQVWHIPLQLGEGQGQQDKVNKKGPPLGAPAGQGKGQVTQSV